jgi:hypothetical protein
VIGNCRESPESKAKSISRDGGGTRLVQRLPDKLGDIEDDLESAPTSRRNIQELRGD